MRNYSIISPSLEGILRHDSVAYDGIRRPAEISRLLDGPARRSERKVSGSGKKSAEPARTLSASEHKIIEQYFSDLHGVFMKKFSQFIFESELRSDDEVKLQAMLQEMIKMKHVMSESRRIDA